MMCLETALNKTDLCLLTVRTMPGQVVWHQNMDLCRCLIHQARYVIAHNVFSLHEYVPSWKKVPLPAYSPDILRESLTLP